MIPYSILDLSPIPEGGSASDALWRTGELARHAEAWGYKRYWLAEHHNMPGIASSATAVLIAHVASQTETIRVGSGGVMLPNHAPLVIAEQFGTLSTLYGDRIDLGLGRAPGTDARTAHALRRGRMEDNFPDEVVELLGYLSPSVADQPVRAIPGEGTKVPVWILGSSLFGAQLAAHLGLPYAFASHFAPDALEPAIQTYRERFQPGLTKAPCFMLAVNVFAADTDVDAHRLRSSQLLGFINLRTGRPGPLPAPVDDIATVATPQVVQTADSQLRVAAVGAPDTVRAQLAAMIERYQPDELILTGQIHDHAARLKSFEIAADILKNL
ncbi:LLM class flavin-dependent oxidoreductase [Alisedimentitalea sp. MJ-SS2]|uniref:LLM class flavin-dependent oxidoreductase n=1 Tax=Aliisedimentitalea sp. MJ-SS2 TaxID=3049795 RepID=UPI00290A02BC|nr:LLM class flavin-dependent oxidoreductase [Alisedimentitalea sp. MJ-SS2]MDU8926954.1 LLM class flavin-dependent oxidoreductase [Alisedimentitalea sp. MJ-SS2]